MDSTNRGTFMIEQMAKKLKLQPQRRETLLVSTFGTKKPHNLKTSVVEFSITTKEGLIVVLHANMLQQITSPIKDTGFLQTIAPDKLTDSIPVQLSSATIEI